MKDLTAQQAADFAPILAAFPQSYFRNDGDPRVVLDLTHTFGHTHTVEIDYLGNVEFTDMDKRMTMDASNVADLAEASVKASKLFDAWQKTESGEAWIPA